MLTTAPVIPLLTLISFLFFLTFSDWLAGIILRAGLIGQIIVGLIYGVPIGDILPLDWQETFIALGYLGLILIVFEGGLTVRLDLLRKNFLLSVCAACVGILTPIAFCYLLLYLGFGYGPIETFIIGAALSATSLGTTFVVMSPANTGLDFAQTTVGIVLLSAALLDDISALVMVSVVYKLGALAGTMKTLSLHPPLASAGSSAGPSRYAEPRLAPYGHVPNIILMTLVLCAFVAISGFAGASSVEKAEQVEGKAPTFAHSFEKYVGGAQTSVDREAIWKGIVTTLLMVVGKMLVGVVVPISDALSRRKNTDKTTDGGLLQRTWKPATFLGMAMVARGEIGLLIIQVGLNETSYLSQPAFITAAWAIILNTIIGPVCVGLLIKVHKISIYEDERWGAQEKEVAGGPETPTTHADDEVDQHNYEERLRGRGITGPFSFNIGEDAHASSELWVGPLGCTIVARLQGDDPIRDSILEVLVAGYMYPA
ncbi:unnamed protein product [Parascedosporium putredinis]|uniref:Cation/H+ exchanger transmembrane domain-containing protein n=1 Tax=Parascedosporium putredinis TaxID=1442378 RepID=A0A9P1M9Z1_9PEZI|nr:unnamed protein product [Parascedosporium putredinis]CAI7991761.1 unnamed protein product [Parascedosporium putredinis]